MRPIPAEPPPFFHRGPSQFARLAFFGLLSIALMFADTRFRYLEGVRQVAAVALYPLQRAVQLPGEAVAWVADYFASKRALAHNGGTVPDVRAGVRGRVPAFPAVTVPGARPRVIAHRGASHDLPEHTPAAYRRALEVGADGLECDVRLSADGHLVCVHDARVDRTSSGRGPVSGMRLDQLRSLDWGSWMPDGARSGSAGDSAYGDSDEGGGDLEPGRRELLSLRELFVLARDCGRPVELAVESKHPNRFGARVEEALVDLLTEFGWQHGGSGVGSGEGRHWSASKSPTAAS